ncbi:hypothetical protein U0070_023663 [Myodes glareolus]|uniref:Uncharacterized protein n=1 Tax=Myodes glareolus TaxID=447135 RepID=A0AAW0INV1_MYOGA
MIERTKSLNMAIRDITAQVCSGERLCSSLRRRLSDLDTRLPQLLEAKMLAISGSHFCTAKELTEEIRALSSEQEGLESLLGRLLALSSRSIRRLSSVKEDYIRCSQDLALQEAAHICTVGTDFVSPLQCNKSSDHVTLSWRLLLASFWLHPDHSPITSTALHALCCAACPVLRCIPCGTGPTSSASPPGAHLQLVSSGFRPDSGRVIVTPAVMLRDYSFRSAMFNGILNGIYEEPHRL